MCGCKREGASVCQCVCKRELERETERESTAGINLERGTRGSVLIVQEHNLYTPIFGQTSPTFCPKSPIFCPKRPVFFQKSPVLYIKTHMYSVIVLIVRKYHLCTYTKKSNIFQVKRALSSAKRAVSCAKRAL